MGLAGISACANVDDSHCIDCRDCADAAEADGSMEEFGVGANMFWVGRAGREARRRAENQRDLEKVAGKMSKKLVGSDWEAVGGVWGRFAFVKIKS